MSPTLLQLILSLLRFVVVLLCMHSLGSRKWNGLNTIDFLTRAPYFDGEGRLMLYSMGSALSEREGVRPPTTMVHMRSTHLTPEKRAWFVASVAGKESAIVEMQYESRSGNWQPKNFRWDKSAPNFMTTVIGTLETVRQMHWLAATH